MENSFNADCLKLTCPALYLEESIHSFRSIKLKYWVGQPTVLSLVGCPSSTLVTQVSQNRFQQANKLRTFQLTTKCIDTPILKRKLQIIRTTNSRPFCEISVIIILMQTWQFWSNVGIKAYSFLCMKVCQVKITTNYRNGTTKLYSSLILYCHRGEVLECPRYTTVWSSVRSYQWL